jgi:microcystin-dependent protein
VENATLTISQLPTHTHQIRASSQAGSLAGPAGAYPAGSNVQKIYGSAADVLMTDTVVGPQSALAQHDNMMPYLCCNYIICLQGYFPMRD